MLYEFACENPKCDYNDIIEEIMSYEKSENNPPICPACKSPMIRLLSKIEKHISWGLWAVSDNAGRKR